MAYLSRLEYLEAERREVLDVVPPFGDRETRDELGIGTVRGAYADLIAPVACVYEPSSWMIHYLPTLPHGHKTSAIEKCS